MAQHHPDVPAPESSPVAVPADGLGAKRSRWPMLAKLAVSASLLGYLAWTVEWSAIFLRLRRIDLPLFAMAWVALSLPILLTSLRWQVILRSQAIILPIRKVVAFDVVALFFNAFLPGTTGGDAIRVVYAIRSYPREKTRIVLSILFDRGMGLAVLVVFALAVLWGGTTALTEVPWVGRTAAAGVWLIAATGAALAVLVLLPFVDRTGPVRWLKSRLPSLVVAQRSYTFLREIGSRPATIAAVAIVSAVSYLFNFLSGYLVARSLGLEISYTETIVVLAVTYTITALPIAISGHGVRELVIITLFGLMAVGAPEVKEAAIAFSIALFSVQLLWSLVGGAVFLAYRHEGALQPHDRPGGG